MRQDESAQRLTLNELLRREGRSFEEIAEAVMFGDENAPALWSEGCEVEPDGTREHLISSAGKRQIWGVWRLRHRTAMHSGVYPRLSTQ